MDDKTNTAVDVPDINVFHKKWHRRFLQRAVDTTDPKITKDAFLEPMALIGRIQNLLIDFYADVKHQGWQASDFPDPRVKLSEPKSRFHTANPFFNAATLLDYANVYLRQWEDARSGKTEQVEFLWSIIPQHMRDMVEQALEKQEEVKRVATESVDLRGKL